MKTTVTCPHTPSEPLPQKTAMPPCAGEMADTQDLLGRETLVSLEIGFTISQQTQVAAAIRPCNCAPGARARS